MSEFPNQHDGSGGNKSDANRYVPEFPTAPLSVGISECLTGGAVRYDGGHKKSSLPHDKLQGLFQFHSICPEVVASFDPSHCSFFSATDSSQLRF